MHLFGHHHLSLGPLPGPGGSTLIGLDHLGFRRGTLQPRCWGILELSGARVRWTWGDDFDWITPLNRKNWSMNTTLFESPMTYSRLWIWRAPGWLPSPPAS